MCISTNPTPSQLPRILVNTSPPLGRSSKVFLFAVAYSWASTTPQISRRSNPPSTASKSTRCMITEHPSRHSRAERRHLPTQNVIILTSTVNTEAEHRHEGGLVILPYQLNCPQRSDSKNDIPIKLSREFALRIVRGQSFLYQ